MPASPSRSRRRRLVGRLPFGALITLAETAFLRSRLGALTALAPAGDRSEAGDESSSDTVWLVGRGVDLPVDVRRAAVAHLDAHGLEWLDLVPVDLPVDRLFELLRTVDSRRFRDDRTAAGRTAGAAMVMRGALAERLDLDDLVESREAARPVELARVAVRAKRYAPTGCDIAVAAGWRGGDVEPLDLPELRELWGPGISVRLGVPIAQALLHARTLARRDPVGVASWVAVALQPALVVAGNRLGLQPSGLARDTLTHPFRPGLRSARALLSAEPSRQRLAIEAARPEYEAELALGADRFFAERAATCPWCESSSISPLVEVGDLLQQKPGMFALDRCADCGHVFQNPRVNEEGLAFYYRDFYDGLSAEKVEWGFQKSVASYRDRTAMVQRQTQPRAWLDVGGGHGHFCLIARGELPDTTFDALDQADSIVEAERRGWVDQAHRGAFVERASELHGRYDVVSMHHYLEHTVDPKAELDAAAKLLPPGGHLLIEVPDPEFALAGRLGRWWSSYLQPQHLHLLPLANLDEALRARGFEVVDVERSKAHQPIDLFAAAWTATRLAAPPTDLPWLPPRTPARVARQVVAYAAASPVLLAALAGDQLVRQTLGPDDHGNTYRLLARRT
jgi:SAM-dependent methyltransferase